MMKFNCLLPVTLVAMISSAAMAQTAATTAALPSASVASPSPSAGGVVSTTPVAASPTADPAPACELHVWPAARVAAETQGMASGFGLLGAIIDASAHADQNKRDQAFITATLDAHAQAKALRELDLPTLLHLPPSTVIIHEQGINLKSDDTNRLTNSAAKCYSEFVVRGLTYFKNIAHPAQMRTFLSIRKFDGAIIKADFRDSKHEDLEAKLPKEGEDTGPATDALMAAFKFDVNFFANKFVKQHS